MAFSSTTITNNSSDIYFEENASVVVSVTFMEEIPSVVSVAMPEQKASVVSVGINGMTL